MVVNKFENSVHKANIYKIKTKTHFKWSELHCRMIKPSQNLQHYIIVAVSKYIGLLMYGFVNGVNATCSIR